MSLIVLARPIEIEIDRKGRNAEGIHDGLKTVDGVSGVTIRDGRAYVSYSGDIAALRALEDLVVRGER